MILLRILMGLFEGVLFPSLSVLLAAWVPERERGKLGSLTLSGPQVRIIISFNFDSFYLFPVALGRESFILLFIRINCVL